MNTTEIEAILNDLLLSLNRLQYCMLICPSKDVAVYPTEVPKSLDRQIPGIFEENSEIFGELLNDVGAASLVGDVELVAVKFLDITDLMMVYVVHQDAFLQLYYDKIPGLSLGAELVRNDAIQKLTSILSQEI